MQHPIHLFHEWFEQAKALDVHEPTAVVVATATKEGIPSARVLLLKGYDERGFCIYTNLTSRKGKEIQENPHVALCFYWDEIDKQVRVEGKVERVTEAEADAYFATRSRGSQMGAWASKQSCVMDAEMDLPDRLKQITEQFAGQVIPRPPFWSGFRVVPERIEFWDKREYRLHKRLVYNLVAGQWQTELLYP